MLRISASLTFRLTTFGTFGYQQIQVNVHYFKLGFNEFTGSDILYVLSLPRCIPNVFRIIGSMLEEILTSAYDRTIDPTPMESSVCFNIPA